MQFSYERPRGANITKEDILDEDVVIRFIEHDPEYEADGGSKFGPSPRTKCDVLVVTGPMSGEFHAEVYFFGNSAKNLDQLVGGEGGTFTSARLNKKGRAFVFSPLVGDERIQAEEFAKKYWEAGKKKPGVNVLSNENEGTPVKKPEAPF